MEVTRKEREDRAEEEINEKHRSALEQIEDKAATIIEHPDDVRRHKQIRRRLDVSSYHSRMT